MIKNKMGAALASLALVPVVVMTTACEPACSGLSASGRDKEAASQGYEVEKVDSMGNECELQSDGSWSVDD